MRVPTEGYRLTDISPKAYEHPADRAATAALASVPMLDQVVRKLIEFGYERALRQSYLGASVKLGPDQLPNVWAVYQRALHTLDMPDEYDLYITQQPVANAMAIGAEKPIIVLNSGLVNLLDEEELLARPLARDRAHPLRPRPLPDGPRDPPAADDLAPAAARRPTAHRRAHGAARVVARGGALLRPRRGARDARPARRVPHAHAPDRRLGVGPAQPRRLPRAGLGVPRGRQGRRQPPAPVARARRDPRAARPPRARGHGVGARRRLQPHRRRRVPAPRRPGDRAARRRPRPSPSTASASRARSATSARTWRRRATRWPTGCAGRATSPATRRPTTRTGAPPPP